MTIRLRACVASLAVASAALPWRAPASQDLRAGRTASVVHAVRFEGEIAIDGVLDEAAWASAPAFTDFVQLFPDEGRAPTERTEVRVMYGRTTLFVGVKCLDRRPAEIVRPLGRRDTVPASDLVRVYIDASGGGRSSFEFVITAGGVFADALVYDDDQETFDWDTVWDGAAALLSDGWSAELAIPLAAFPLPHASGESWRFGVQRELGRNHERSATMFIERSARGLSSRLGTLAGMEALEWRADVELAPYVATRVSQRPQYSDPARPAPRLLEPVGFAGADFRIRLGARFAMTGTVNPDFGQVEADQIILNLSSFENYFPEKRPFFTQGLDLFKSVGDGYEQPPQQLFYSRRIGLGAPILGAAKVDGRAGDRFQIGVLDAVVSGTAQGSRAAESAPDRAVRWTWAQPLQLGPGFAYPMQAPVPQNFVAAVARAGLTDNVVIGARMTSAVPMAPACTAADLAGPATAPGRCVAAGGNALALDFNVTSHDKEWHSYGQFAGSQVVGGPPSRILRDGTVLERGDLGYGGYVRAGRRGGEPWRFDVAWSYATPRFDLDASGFMRTQNLQNASATLKYARPSGGGPWHEYAAWLKGWSLWATDSRALSRGYGAVAGFDGRSRLWYLGVHCTLEYTNGRYDLREIKRAVGSTDGSGVALELPWWIVPTCSVETDPTLPLSATIGGYVGTERPPSPIPPSWYYGGAATVTWRPHPRAETRLDLGFDDTNDVVRYVGGSAPAPLLLGAMRAPTLSVTLRESYLFTPRLSVQVYGQLFTAYARYGPFYAAEPGTPTIALRALRPIDPRSDATFASYAHPDYKQVRFVTNAVLRWEYRPGSVIHVVYSRTQSASPWDTEAPQLHSLSPGRLASGPTVDSMLVKMTFFVRT